MDSRARKFMISWISTFFFLSYYFLKLSDQFFFQETYAFQLQKRYRDDPSTHPELDLDFWLEVGLSDGPSKNQIYDISNTTTEDKRMGHSVSIISFLQSGLSSQYLVSQAIITAKTTRLSAEMAKIRRLYMKLLSNLDSTCGPPNPGEYPSLPPPSPLASVLQINCIQIDNL